MFKDFDEELQELQPTHDLHFSQSRRLAGRFINSNEDDIMELPEPKYLNKESENENENNQLDIILALRSCNINSSSCEYLSGKKTLPTPGTKADTLQNGSLTILLGEEFFKFPPLPEPRDESLNKEESQKNSSPEYSTASDYTNSSYYYPNSSASSSSLYCTAQLLDSTVSEGSSKSCTTIGSSNYFGSDESVSGEDTSKDLLLL